MGKVTVQVVDVVKKFGVVVALNHVSIGVFAGEFFSILGPSGCGKTTLLRIIAGLEDPDSGAIYLGGKLIDTTPAYRRDVNTVFQNYALFPHMSVYENVAFGLRMKKVKKGDIDERVTEALDLVGLPGMGSRKPRQLSGGQQQRAALARALVNEPPLLLLDEPLGALDLKLRKQMQMELKSLQKRLGITFIYVTHDQEEALTMSDRIAVMCAGEVKQVGTPSQVYEEPKTEFVANFIGISNLFPGDLRITDLGSPSQALEKLEQRANVGESSPATRNSDSPCARKENQEGNGSVLTLTTPDGLKIRASATNGVRTPRTATVMVRPEKILITPHKPEGDMNVLSGRIEEIVYLGTVTQFIVNISNRKLVVLEKNYNKESEFEVDQKAFVSWDISSTVVLPGM